MWRNKARLLRLAHDLAVSSFGCARLYEYWHGGDRPEPYQICCIVTTSATSSTRHQDMVAPAVGAWVDHLRGVGSRIHLAPTGDD